jgi:hypothetical protein
MPLLQARHTSSGRLTPWGIFAPAGLQRRWYCLAFFAGVQGAAPVPGYP